MQEIHVIIGSISGIISLLSLIYLVGFWRGQVDTDRRAFRECITQYPPAEMWTMVKTLWDIYVIDALHHRPDLATHGSGFKLSKEGKDLIPDYMKPILMKIPRNPLNQESIATGYLVVKYIGLEMIGKMAEEEHVTLQEAIAILSTYLDTEVSS